MAAFSVAQSHSRTINLTCCFSAAVCVFGPLLTEGPASASEEDTAQSEAAAAEFSLTLLAFLLLDLLDCEEAVDRCVI